MTRETDATPPVDSADLIAYLHGEVDPRTAEQIERRLAEDPQLAQRLREHQQAWDFLDELPREEASDDFTQTTLRMVAVAAADDVRQHAVTARKRRTWLRAAAGASLIVAALVGFRLASQRLTRADRELLRDLPVIENLDALQQVEDVEFLRALENEGLFVAEVSDEEIP